MLIEKSGQFFKSDGKLIYGWALVCEQKDADGNWTQYVDTQGDHIPEDVMVEAALDFAKNSRIGKDMHDGDQVASVPFIYVVTKNSNELGLATDKTGMLIGWEPSDPALLDAVSKGERTGFSIGGYVLESDDGAEKSKKTKKSKGDAAKSPRIFRRFRIDEISLVDMPAMEGATIGYVKRRQLAKRDASAIEKRSALTTSVLGHAHLIGYLDDAMAGTTSYESLHDPNTPRDHYTGHSHPWVRGEDGLVSIGEAMGHTHEVGALSASLAKSDNKITVSIDPAAFTRALTEPAGARVLAALGANKSTTANVVPTVKTNTEMPMPDNTADQTKIADLEKKLTATRKLSADEHAVWQSLSGGDADAFLAKSTADRATQVAEFAKGREVEYTADDGTVYTKRDDARLVKMAKTADTERRARVDAELAKRADADLGNFIGETADKVALLKSFKWLDEAQRDAVEKMIKSADAALALAAKMQGVTEGPANEGDALAKFNAGVDAFAKKNDIKDPGLALEKFLGTKEGLALKKSYDATRAYGRQAQ